MTRTHAQILMALGTLPSASDAQRKHAVRLADIAALVAAEHRSTSEPVLITEHWPNDPPKDQDAELCVHCGRAIVLDGGIWIDPEATGDDSLWREVCDAHDTFEANHEPFDSA